MVTSIRCRSPPRRGATRYIVVSSCILPYTGPMSRVRTRPTRDDTREKLFEAAARVFEEEGIGGASIEAIAAAAGFSRGAFYSNFASKDELIIAMLEDHVAQTVRRNLELFSQHKTLADF